MHSLARPAKLKLAVICPHFPPQPGGVSDYVGRLCGEFARQGHEVIAWTAEPGVAPIAGVEFRVKKADPVSGWNLATYREIEREIRESGAQSTILQYTPYLYGPRRWGLHPALSLWMPGLGRRLGGRVALLAHELHYPLGLSADRLLIGTSQLLQFLALAHFAEQIWFTYEVPLLRYRRLFPWAAERFSWFPVGSAIEPGPAGSVPALRDEWSQGKRVLLQFGSAHPSRPFDHSFLALRESRRALLGRGEEAVLAFVGLDDATVQAKIAEKGLQELAPLVRGLGYLSARETSAWMERADAVLAPFVDGISARRSSVMVALSHGKPLITTHGIHTDPTVGWERIAALAPAGDAPGFARLAGEVLSDPVRAEALGRAARARFEELFAWPKLAAGMIARLTPANGAAAPDACADAGAAR
ncbi:MAG: glycosyltransferase family 4 protein [Oligoflexia bacterium]|nr:glycosyltransferase family 4 protein [Oligoflexia bacterium]